MGRTGQKVQKSGLGGALLKTQKKSSAVNTTDIQSSAGRHVSARDGGDASVALASYLEGSSLDDFLANAVLANREFTAVRESILIMEDEPGAIVIDREQMLAPEMTHTELKVPRRPSWDASTTPDELNRREKESFMEWRRDIAMLEESSADLEVTPFEKNLEVWRQLWHVRERSDVIVQIVDARNPLFYRSNDLDAYAKEGDVPRRTLLVINKSDFLDERQRTVWGNYFTSQNIEFVFFSAKLAQDEIDELAKQQRLLERLEESDVDANASADEADEDEEDDDEEEVETTVANPVAPTPTRSEPDDSAATSTGYKSPYPLLSRVDLLAYLDAIAQVVLTEVGLRVKDRGLIKFGMVGFPNVGKSSVINALLGASTFLHKTQRVAVGATPGKTKHFQTLVLSDAIMLCDCPGLVFPSFVNSKAEMYCCGVLPISQLRDHIGPCQLMCYRIPKRVFERTYGMKIPIRKVAKETDVVEVYPLLEAFARLRGYNTAGKGGPDTSRAARDLLRDYVNGKLRYCHAPPNVEDDPEVFDIHYIALQQFPDLTFDDEADNLTPVDEVNEGDVDAAAEAALDESLDFDRAVVEDKRLVLSKRLKNHGKKGRKGRDKNPYEDSDMPTGTSVVHINQGGKKRTNPRERYNL